MSNTFACEDKPKLDAQQYSLRSADFEDLSPALLRTDERLGKVRLGSRQLIVAGSAGAGVN